MVMGFARWGSAGLGCGKHFVVGEAGEIMGKVCAQVVGKMIVAVTRSARRKVYTCMWSKRAFPPSRQ